MREKTYKQIQAVKTSGEILKFVANEKEMPTAPEVTRALNMSIGTVMCHLTTLAEIGFLKQVGDRYELGMGLALFWARKRARLEGERDTVTRNLQELEAKDE
jgi:DNA-binding IclR family transcriptional regulator